MVLMFAGAANAGEEGIFADLETSRGTITVRLDYENAPRAVANFIGLATGEGGWLDAQSNVWHRPFYDGSLIHRIALDSQTNALAIQGGGLLQALPVTNDVQIAELVEGYTGEIVSTNPPGVSTNILNVPIVVSNPPALATNYVWHDVVYETNAPAMVSAWLTVKVASRNSLLSQDQLTTREGPYGFTNLTTTAVITTNFVPMTVVITNTLQQNVETTHTITVSNQMEHIQRIPTVTTNFLNAGYTMLDNVTNGLTHSSGVIAMANSGPNTDGSQFFITVTNMPSWDGSYTVFGNVVSNMNVVCDIAGSTVDSVNTRPLEDIVVNRVNVRRVGAAAQAFDIAAQGVPSPESTPIGLAREGSNVTLSVELASNTRPLMFSDTTDVKSFAEWEHQVMFPSSSLWFYTGPTFILTDSWPLADLGARHFFHVSRVFYPEPITTPTTHVGRTFTFYWDTVDGEPANWIYKDEHSTNLLDYGWFQEGTNAPVNREIFYGATWVRDAYMGRLSYLDQILKYDDEGKFIGWLQQYSYTLGFDPGQATNRFTGTFSAKGRLHRMSGTFTVE
jgi:cyclophilin family peptidyl-prolyl cis-trans isomerase